MKIRKAVVYSVVMALYLLAPVIAHAVEAAKPPVTLKGEIVDMWCYLSHEGKGPSHKACAAACIKAGAPMGLLTADGKLYLLLSDHGANAKAYDAAKELAAETVEVKGAEVARNGIPGVVVESVAVAK